MESYVSKILHEIAKEQNWEEAEVNVYIKMYLLLVFLLEKFFDYKILSKLSINQK